MADKPDHIGTLGVGQARQNLCDQAHGHPSIRTKTVANVVAKSWEDMNKQVTTAQQQSRLKELIAKGKEQGYLTYGEVNDHLPDDISDPEQIEDIIRMIKTNISEDKIKFYNLHKSFFSDLDNTSCEVFDNKVVIFENSNENSDPASVELELKKDDIYSIYYWDGYSLADTYQTKDYISAIKNYKKYAKKLAKNLRRY